MDTVSYPPLMPFSFGFNGWDLLVTLVFGATMWYLYKYKPARDAGDDEQDKKVKEE